MTTAFGHFPFLGILVYIQACVSNCKVFFMFRLTIITVLLCLSFVLIHITHDGEEALEFGLSFRLRLADRRLPEGV